MQICQDAFRWQGLKVISDYETEMRTSMELKPLVALRVGDGERSRTDVGRRPAPS
jgi:IS4 transposase